MRRLLMLGRRTFETDPTKRFTTAILLDSPADHSPERPLCAFKDSLAFRNATRWWDDSGCASEIAAESPGTALEALRVDWAGTGWRGSAESLGRVLRVIT